MYGYIISSEISHKNQKNEKYKSIKKTSIYRCCVYSVMDVMYTQQSCVLFKIPRMIGPGGMLLAMYTS